MTPRAGIGLLVATLLALTACGPDVRGVALEDVPGGDKSRGKAAIAEHGCGSCHAIPAIPGAQGLVGPPLTNFARRKYIVGALPNNADNLIAWLRDPQALEPGTIMPNLGLTEAEARDLAAYLATLR
jgi:cytochrome c1